MYNIPCIDATIESFDSLSDSDKQTIASEYINSQVVYLQNEVVEFILNASVHSNCDETPFNGDDITNKVPTGEVEINGAYHTLTEEQKNEWVEGLDLGSDRLNEEAEEALNDMEFENYPEIYQWFLVGDSLAYNLEKQGECMLDKTYWGRQACGQAIILDNVIQRIAFTVMSEKVP